MILRLRFCTAFFSPFFFFFSGRRELLLFYVFIPLLHCRIEAPLHADRLQKYRSPHLAKHRPSLYIISFRYFFFSLTFFSQVYSQFLRLLFFFFLVILFLAGVSLPFCTQNINNYLFMQNSRLWRGTLVSSAPHYITTNVVGGLGNQLFLIANLLATAKRNGLVPVLPPVPWSSSCEAPRPTYWDSIFSELHQMDVSAGGLRVLKSFPEELFSQENTTSRFIGTEKGLRKGSEGFPLSLSSISSPPCSSIRVVDIPESRPLVPICILPSSSSSSTKTVVYQLVGFFQSSSLFQDCEDLIQKFLVPNDLHTLARTVLKRCYHPYSVQEKGSSSSGIPLHSSHIVGMHIRRGDYTRMKDVFAYLTLEEYYTKALTQLFGRLLLRPLPSLESSSFTTPVSVLPLHLLIFCEEPDEGQAAVRFFRSRFPAIQVTHCHPNEEMKNMCLNNHKNTSVADNTALSPSLQSVYSRTPREVLELLLLAHCDDIIMANSTFSWWSAYFRKACGKSNTDEGAPSLSAKESELHRVIAPSSWFVNQSFTEYMHLYQKGWMIL